MRHRVLIVDDEPEVVAHMRSVLEKAGYDTLTATTFDEGRRLLHAEPYPDALVADVRLGQYNGLQLVVIRRPPTRAVVVSGHWDRTLEAEARRQSASYLLKPVTAAQLVDAVSRAIAGSETQPAP